MRMEMALWFANRAMAFPNRRDSEWEDKKEEGAPSDVQARCCLLNLLSSSVEAWYRRISLRATVPGR